MDDWRRIDVDALDPEGRMTLEELTPDVQAVSPAEIEDKITHIRNYISKGAFSDAISFVTQDPPYGADQASKSKYLTFVLDLFSAVKQSEIPTIVKGLSDEQQNALIKYLYKGMSTTKGQQQGGVLLSWYDKTVEVAGLAPVVRYLSDRRTV